MVDESNNMVGKVKIFVVIIVLLTLLINCSRRHQAPSPAVLTPLDSLAQAPQPEPPVTTPKERERVRYDLPIEMGAQRPDQYLHLLAGQRVGLVVNHTSLLDTIHLVDWLLAQGVQVTRIFAPEHGFRGTADAGEKIADGLDPHTGLPLVSLYGRKREPDATDLADVDWLVFDIQDVGVRYYTYLSTLHNVMRAAARENKPLLVLDRPNPNGHYVDGPILDTAYRSFVGMHPVPIVHGLTVGEYAQMINAEGWLGNGLRCNLTVAPCANYDHSRPYTLPVAPSPNLPNMRSIYLYPSLCLFEGTSFSLGRGTDYQFQIYGHPDYPIGNFYFKPMPKPGAQNPPQQGQWCRGYNLTDLGPDSLRQAARIDLNYVIEAYHNHPDTAGFFLANRFFDRLAGGPTLRQQIQAGLDSEAIRASWKSALAAFRNKRRPYLLYPE